MVKQVVKQLSPKNLFLVRKTGHSAKIGGHFEDNRGSQCVFSLVAVLSFIFAVGGTVHHALHQKYFIANQNA